MLCIFDDVSAEDQEYLVSLVKQHYPGLLERGTVEWGVLQRNRHRRYGSVTLETARRLICRYNQEIDEEIKRNIRAGRPSVAASLQKDKRDLDHVADWPLNLQLLRTMIAGSAAADGAGQGDTSFSEALPVAVTCRDGAAADDRNCKQMVYGMWVPAVARYRYPADRIIMSPLSRATPPSELTSMEAVHSVPLQLAASSAVMARSSARYPLRIILCEGWRRRLSRDRTAPEVMRRYPLAGMLFLRYGGSDPNSFGHPHVNDSYYPLFIFDQSGRSDPAAPAPNRAPAARRYFAEHMKLRTYAGHLVDWGDYSKRKRITYYELCDVMMHLTPQARGPDAWRLLRVPRSLHASRDDTNEHFLVRPRRRTDEEERAEIESERARGLTPACIVWNEQDQSLDIRDEGGDGCRPDGWQDAQRDLAVDDERYGLTFSGRRPPAASRLASGRHGHEENVLIMDRRRWLDAAVRSTARPELPMAGVYGAEAGERRPWHDFRHLDSAVRYWRSATAPEHNPMRLLNYLASPAQRPAVVYIGRSGQERDEDVDDDDYHDDYHDHDEHRGTLERRALLRKYPGSVGEFNSTRNGWVGGGGPNESRRRASSSGAVSAAAALLLAAVCALAAAAPRG